MRHIAVTDLLGDHMDAQRRVCQEALGLLDAHAVEQLQEILIRVPVDELGQVPLADVDVDDLAMGAITETYGVGEAAVLAILAGNDLLCSTDYALQYGAVLEAAKEGRIQEETIDAAVLRILRWKLSLGLDI